MKALALLLLLSGCATFIDKGIGGPAGFTACKAADATTTTLALHHGAHEVGFLMRPVFATFGYAGIWGVSAALVAAAWYWQDVIPKPAFGVANGITCGAAIYNIRAI